jgi:hypothetical protein
VDASAAQGPQSVDALRGLRPALRHVAERHDLVDALALELTQHGVERDCVPVHVGNQRDARGHEGSLSVRGEGTDDGRIVRNQVERVRVRRAPACFVLDDVSPEQDAAEDASHRSRLVAAAEIREDGSRLARRVDAAGAFRAGRLVARAK